MKAKTINIVLQKKWRDFIHPTRIEHYGYVFTVLQMRQFPEGRLILCVFKKRKRIVKDISRHISPLIAACNNTIDDLIRDVINEG